MLEFARLVARPKRADVGKREKGACTLAQGACYYLVQLGHDKVHMFVARLFRKHNLFAYVITMF